MSRIPIAYTTHLDTLWQAHLLCEICEEQAWTRRGTWHAVLLCADCAADEPALEDEP